MSSPPTFDIVKDLTLVPVDGQELLDPVDLSITLNLDFRVINGSNRSVHYLHARMALFNNITYVGQRVPSLFTALSTGTLAMDPKVYGVSLNPFVLS